MLESPANICQMTAAMESCVGKSAMAGVGGFGLGGMFGMFMASVSRSPLPDNEVSAETWN